MNFESSLNSALALALLAFDATRTSVTDVDYPIDVAVLPMGTRRPVFRRYEMSDLQVTTAWWSQVLRDSLKSMPMNWAQELLGQATNLRAPGKTAAAQTSHLPIHEQVKVPMSTILVGSELSYDVRKSTVLLLKISAAQTDHQKIVHEE